jgi:hypothetical protein
MRFLSSPRGLEVHECSRELLKTTMDRESIVRAVWLSLAGAAPELLLFFNACTAQLLDC